MPPQSRECLLPQDLAGECGAAMTALRLPAPVPLSARGDEPLACLVAAAQQEAHAHIPLTPSLRVQQPPLAWGSKQPSMGCTACYAMNPVWFSALTDLGPGAA